MPTAHIMTKVFNETTYNCAYFAVDVWEHFTGRSLHAQLAGVMESPDERTVTRDLYNGFQEVAAASEPCVVLMERRDGKLHMGVFVDNRVWHLSSLGPHAATFLQLKKMYRNLRFFVWIG